MRILISNDDGIQSPGVEALVKALYKDHEVIVAAPASQQSAKSHAITVNERLYVDEYAPLQEKYGVKALAITGTPADTVKLYMEGLIRMDKSKMPDLVISGINNGSNQGTDIIYSGTIGAAMEGFIHRVNALAVSLEYNAELSFDFVAEQVVAKLPELFPAAEKKKRILNVNFPVKLRDDYKWLWARQGVRDYSNAYIPQHEGDRLFYTVGGTPLTVGNTPETDVLIVDAGNISVTSLILDRTDYASMNLGEEL